MENVINILSVKKEIDKDFKTTREIRVKFRDGDNEIIILKPIKKRVDNEPKKI